MRSGRHHSGERGRHHDMEGGRHGHRERLGGHGLGRRRRMFESGDFRILLLTLLAEQPRHGYELIRAIEEMFGGQYAPSPGIVYPTLAMLEEQGHAEPRAEAIEDGRKRFAITADGLTWLRENADAVAGVRARLALEVRSIRASQVPEAVRQGVRTLKHALMLDHADWPEARTRSVLQALEQAIAAVGEGTAK
jgi:DNA-binding PadR family transcriptional regulator